MLYCLVSREKQYCKLINLDTLKIGMPVLEKQASVTSIQNKVLLKKVEFCVKFAPNSTQIQHAVSFIY